MSSLLGHEAIDDVPTVEPRPPVVVPLGASGDHVTSAERILARNPFDSVTGALNGVPVQLNVPPPTEVEDAGPSEDDPTCDSARVRLIVTADDPEWSFASIAGQQGDAQLRRLGDDVGGRTVNAITWDRVWLTGGGPRCQIRLGDAPLAAAKKAPSIAPRKGKKPSSTALPPDIAAKIHKISDNEYNVDRSALDAILEQQAVLMRSIRLAPVKEGGKVSGYRLSRVAPDSLLGSIGLLANDQVKSINGFDLTDPQKALEAYSKLRTADNLTVAIKRGGKDSTIDLHFK